MAHSDIPNNDDPSGNFCYYRMAGNFRGKSEKALKFNFRGFKFHDSNQSRGMALLHKR